MRKRVWVQTQSSSAEFIGVWKRTQGTETSKYLEEKKETSIPSVAASESGNSPNRARIWRSCAISNLKIKFWPGVAEALRGYKTVDSGTVWKVWPQRVKAPYATSTGPR